MSKVTAPLMSMGASGALGGAIVFSRWKGRPYVRALVVPANPRSDGQVGLRAMFGFLAAQWAGLSVLNKATWDDPAEALNVSPFNSYMRGNQFQWRNNLAPSQVYPYAPSGLTVSAPTLTGTAGERSITIDIADGAQAPDWGYILVRKLAADPTQSWAFCKAVLEVDPSGTTTFVDSPLDAGEYRYAAWGFASDGSEGTLSVVETVNLT